MEWLKEYGELLGTLGGFGTLVLIAWKGGGFASWVRGNIGHLTQSVDRIEGKVTDFRKENDEQHTRIHKRIDKMQEDK